MSTDARPEPPPSITESWSDDGLTLTLTGTYPDGDEADVSASWKTREKAEANADKFRSGAEDMLRNRRFDITVARGRIKRSKARRVGPFIVGFGTGYPFRLVPEFATGGKLGVRWATGYVVASHRPRRSQ